MLEVDSVVISVVLVVGSGVLEGVTEVLVSSVLSLRQEENRVF